MSQMRAKFQVSHVTQHKDTNGNVTNEIVRFHAVAKSSSYGTDGLDEDNTYARFTPSAYCEINIANPALFGKYVAGEKYYVDFSPMPVAVAQ